MSGDADIQARWNQVRHDLLNLLLEFHDQWNTAFAVSHACGHLKTPDVEKCKISLENAQASMEGLEDMFDRYKRTIEEMRTIVTEISEAGRPERPD